MLLLLCTTTFSSLGLVLLPFRLAFLLVFSGTELVLLSPSPREREREYV